MKRGLLLLIILLIAVPVVASTVRENLGGGEYSLSYPNVSSFKVYGNATETVEHVYISEKDSLASVKKTYTVNGRKLINVTVASFVGQDVLAGKNVAVYGYFNGSAFIKVANSGGTIHWYIYNYKTGETLADFSYNAGTSTTIAPYRVEFNYDTGEVIIHVWAGDYENEFNYTNYINIKDVVGEWKFELYYYSSSWNVYLEYYYYDYSYTGTIGYASISIDNIEVLHYEDGTLTLYDGITHTYEVPNNLSEIYIYYGNAYVILAKDTYGFTYRADFTHECGDMVADLDIVGNVTLVVDYTPETTTTAASETVTATNVSSVLPYMAIALLIVFSIIILGEKGIFAVVPFLYILAIADIIDIWIPAVGTIALILYIAYNVIIRRRGGAV